MMGKYVHIIERLEKATGPSRDLDCMVWAALNPQANVKEVSPAYGNERKTRIMFTLPPKRTELVTKDIGEFQDAFDWTSSLDTSIELVDMMLPGCIWTIERDACWVRVISGDDVNEYQGFLLEPVGNCTPIAILIAMFRALEASETDQ
jgi:hypothetical protein